MGRKAPGVLKGYSPHIVVVLCGAISVRVRRDSTSRKMDEQVADWAVVQVLLLRWNDGLIRTTFCLEALSHVHCAVGAAGHLATEMEIMLLRIANRPAALIEQKRLKGNCSPLCVGLTRADGIERGATG